jgi:phytoene synthase
MNAPTLKSSGRSEIGADAAEICARTLALHSKSFALAGKLLPPEQRRDAAVLYTYCRWVDDRIDLADPAEQPAALNELQATLGSVYRGEPQADVRLRAFQELIQRRGVPREYPEALLEGMAMDTAGAHYQTLDELLLYCHRVAGVVGLMMCHVLGISDSRALRNAAHLGIAMQLTNICRDVAEDWQRGRLYLPLAMLRDAGPKAAVRVGLGPLAREARDSIRAVTGKLLAVADRFYDSGDAGMRALPWRAAFSVRAARWIYAAIGGRILRPEHDLFAMRALVPQSQKLILVLKAAIETIGELPQRWLAARAPSQPDSVLRFPDDILPV